MGKLLVFHQSTNTIPSKYHLRSTGAEENQENQGATRSLWRYYWREPCLFPQRPWNKPVLFPRGPGAGPIAAGRATTSHWHGTRRSVDPCAARRGRHRLRMLGGLLAPTTGWPLTSELRQSLASPQCCPAGRAATSPRPLS